MSEASPMASEKAPLTGGTPMGSAMGSMKSTQMHLIQNNIFPWTYLWFVGSLCVMTGAVIAMVQEIETIEWIDALESAYLFLVGLILAFVDTPVFTNLGMVVHFRQAANRFLAIVTRVTGKGVVFCFLGCTLWSSMWSNLEGGIHFVVAFFLGIFILATGLISIFLGILKSKNLNAVRTQLKKDDAAINQYSKFAQANPELGLDDEEFARLAISQIHPVRFEGSDLRLVFSGISSDPNRMYISQQDLDKWVQGGWVFV